MEVQELMIGNWVFDTQKNKMVTIQAIEPNWDNVWLNWANGAAEYKARIDDIAPIVVTAEYLKELGFTLHVRSNGIEKYYKKNNFVVYLIREEYMEIEWIPNQFHISERSHIYGGKLYLHQLQNIYRVLTGELLKYAWLS